MQQYPGEPRFKLASDITSFLTQLNQTPQDQIGKELVTRYAGLVEESARHFGFENHALAGLLQHKAPEQFKALEALQLKMAKEALNENNLQPLSALGIGSQLADAITAIKTHDMQYVNASTVAEQRKTEREALELYQKLGARVGSITAQLNALTHLLDSFTPEEKTQPGYAALLKAFNLDNPISYNEQPLFAVQPKEQLAYFTQYLSKEMLERKDAYYSVTQQAIVANDLTQLNQLYNPDAVPDAIAVLRGQDQHPVFDFAAECIRLAHKLKQTPQDIIDQSLAVQCQTLLNNERELFVPENASLAKFLQDECPQQLSKLREVHAAAISKALDKGGHTALVKAGVDKDLAKDIAAFTNQLNKPAKDAATLDRLNERYQALLQAMEGTVLGHSAFKPFLEQNYSKQLDAMQERQRSLAVISSLRGNNEREIRGALAKAGIDQDAIQAIARLRQLDAEYALAGSRQGAAEQHKARGDIWQYKQQLDKQAIMPKLAKLSRVLGDCPPEVKKLVWVRHAAASCGARSAACLR